MCLISVVEMSTLGNPLLKVLFAVISLQYVTRLFPAEHLLLPQCQRCLTNDTCLPVCAGKNPGQGFSLTLIHPYSLTRIKSKISERSFCWSYYNLSKPTVTKVITLRRTLSNPIFVFLMQIKESEATTYRQSSDSHILLPGSRGSRVTSRSCEGHCDMVPSCTSVSVHGDKICTRSERSASKISLVGNYFLHATQNDCVRGCARFYISLETNHAHKVRNI